MSLLASPTATSFFTINAGAQLTLIPATAAGPQTFTFGSGPLNLNGAGATSGPFAGNPDAIRNDRGTGPNGVFSPVITNAIVLQSNSLVHVQALVGTGGNQTPDGFLTFSGVVSGPGSLALTAPSSDADQGTLFLTAPNTYEGGTFINGGILNVNSDAAFGLATGGVTIVNNARLRAGGALSTTARTLTLGVGGGRIDTNSNDITLGVGSTVTGTALTKIGIGKLTIAGTQTYGSLTTSEGRTDLASALGTGASTITANAETNISVGQTLAALSIGSGAVVTLGAPLPAAPEIADGLESGRASGQVVPEPCSAALLLGGAGLLLGLRRRAIWR